MSERGIEFLNRWATENINAAPFPQENNSEVPPLAEKCIADAERAGISIQEIEEDMGDISDFILEALDEATAQEVDRLASKDD